MQQITYNLLKTIAEINDKSEKTFNETYKNVSKVLGKGHGDLLALGKYFTILESEGPDKMLEMLKSENIESNKIISFEETTDKVNMDELVNFDNPELNELNKNFKFKNSFALNFVKETLNTQNKEKQLMLEAMGSLGYMQNNVNISKSDVEWSVLADMVYNQVKNEIKVYDNIVYIRDEYGAWSEYSEAKNFPMFAIINKIAGKKANQTIKNATKAVMDEMLPINTMVSSTVIQFNDYYIEKDKVKKGIYENIPMFRIVRNIGHLVEGKYLAKEIKEVDDLINHLINGDELTKEYFLFSNATLFFNDPNNNARHAKIINIHGPSGSNGKSTWGKLLTNMLKKHNSKGIVPDNNIVSNTNIAQLGDREFLTDAVKSLLAIDFEFKGETLDKDTTRVLKAMSSGDQISTDAKYKSIKKYNPVTKFIVCTNNPIKSFDKTGGVTRRFDWFKVDKKLERNTEWFNKITSEEAADYVFEKLFMIYLNFLNNGEIPEAPESVKLANTTMSEGNDSALEFLSQYESGNFHNKLVRIVYNQYEKYCEDNKLKVLAASTLQSKIEEMFPDLEIKKKKQFTPKLSNGQFIPYDLNDLDGNQAEIVSHKKVTAHTWQLKG